MGGLLANLPLDGGDVQRGVHQQGGSQQEPQGDTDEAAYMFDNLWLVFVVVAEWPANMQN